MSKKVVAPPAPLPPGVHLTDTHTHLYLDDFQDNTNADGCYDAVQRAIDIGISHMIFPNVNASTIAPMKALAARFPGHIRMAMGLHPTEIVLDTLEDDLACVAAELDKGGYIAVGEIGIDLYWDKSFECQQMKILDTQLDWAERYELPVILHCRDGLNQMLEVLQGHKRLSFVFHSFAGTAQDVERILGDYNAIFGVNGIVTFKRNSVVDILPSIWPDHIVLETDSPYLAPVPYRGRRNESAYIVATAASVAVAVNTDIKCVAEATTRNSLRVLGF